MQQTIRPGLLVSLKTNVCGNVHYRKRDLEADHVTDDGARKAKWETERTIADPAEFEEATKVRGKARSLIAAVCAPSAFGLLCPQSKSEELAAAISEAHDLAAEFNSRATVTTVTVYVITGKIAEDDAEAVRAISSEMRDLLDRMEEGVRNLDVKAIRAAADDARKIGSMLTPGASDRLQEAIDTVRSAARKIVKAGETASVAVDQQVIQTIRASRTTFLDIDNGGAEIATPSVTTGRAIDLDDRPVAVATPKSAAPTMLDLL